MPSRASRPRCRDSRVRIAAVGFTGAPGKAPKPVTRTNFPLSRHVLGAGECSILCGFLNGPVRTCGSDAPFLGRFNGDSWLEEQRIEGSNPRVDLPGPEFQIAPD